jgi:undecaprenyl-diphosphatase
MNLNIQIFRSINNFAFNHPHVGEVGLFAATTFGIIVVACAIAYLLLRSHKAFTTKPLGMLRVRVWEIFYVVFSGSMSWVITSICKEIFQIPRPFVRFDDVHLLIQNESYFSFPSNHASFFASLAMAMYFVNKKAGIIFGILAILIGTSRVVTGVHFPVDIIVGWLIGALVSLLIYKVFKKLRKYNA